MLRMLNVSKHFVFCMSGQSSLNFVYSLVEKQDGAHSGVSPKEGRPTSGQNAQHFLTVIL